MQASFLPPYILLSSSTRIHNLFNSTKQPCQLFACVLPRLTLALSTHKYLLNFKKFSKMVSSQVQSNRPNLQRLGPSTHIRHRFYFLATLCIPFFFSLSLSGSLSHTLSLSVAFAFSYLDYNFFHFTYECVRWLGWPLSRLFFLILNFSSVVLCSVVWVSTCQLPFPFSFPQKEWKSQRNPFRHSAYSRCALRKSQTVLEVATT